MSALELLIGMVIVAVLVCVAAPNYAQQLGRTERKLVRANLSSFEVALAAYHRDLGHYPDSHQGLRALLHQPQGEPKWQGPYLRVAVFTDPWGRHYVYRQPGAGEQPYELLSLGRDGKAGGTQLDADISIWDYREKTDPDRELAPNSH